jgi:subtilisin family serine protease
MKRSLRAALTGLVFVSLASCGGGGEAPGSDLQQPQAASSIRSEKRLDVRDGNARSNRIYIVRLAEPAAASYNGSIRGLAATRPARGSKLDSRHPDVVNYRAHLAARQDAVMRSAGVSKTVRNYGYVFNGFAARMSDAQASKLAATRGVLSVTEDEIRHADTSSTPNFLGLTGKDGFWKEQGAKGEDVIIGIIDSGIWPEHPSFSDRKPRGHGHFFHSHGRDEGDHAYRPIRGWHGTCTVGEQFTADNCNRKLIGARYYNAGFGGDEGIKAIFPYEFNSPRDYDGHGTHTSSTAGGNEGVAVTGDASAFGKISGIAPRARIAMYKALWHDSSVPTSSGTNSDLVAAIDDAVADGVDVINYSISGSRTNFADPVEIAFLFAADAGVFVAASAGNSGPTVSTVAHPSPWITTVAAGVHSRDGKGAVTLGNGATFTGASYTAAVGPAPLIDAALAGAAGATPADVARCFLAADSASGVSQLDPAQVAGKIVLCERGGNVLVNKAQAVKDAGGVGMILANTPTSANTTLPILHVIPTVHIPFTTVEAFTGLKAYAASAGATATIADANFVFDATSPLTASFSSRGPLLAGNGALLKPDLIAPGQDILAGVAPPANNGRLFDLYSGTSMSSPHVAGLAALMKEVNPRWSPMAIKSALMTTAGDVLDGPNTHPLVIFRQGAGHVQPNNAADPGLVFDSDFDDWVGFLCGTASIDPATCPSLGIPILGNASDFNVASIAIGNLVGSQTVTRRVTNVSQGTATYRPSITGMEGVSVNVSPSSLTLHRGQTKSFQVTFTRTSAPLNAYVGGQLTLTGGTSKKARHQHNVRVPMVVKPVALSAPAEVNGSYTVKFGFTGPFSATARGLVPAATTTSSVATNAVVDTVVNIPAGATHARFSLFDANVSAASDLDLEVYNAAGTLVGASGTATSNEEVNLVNPVAGAYTVRVVGFATPNNAAVNFTLFSWVLGNTAAGNMTVTAPANATTGASGTIELAFNGLVGGIKYLGSVLYGGDPAVPPPTIVRVDP